MVLVSSLSLSFLTDDFPGLNVQLPNPQIHLMSHFDDQILNVQGAGFIRLEFRYNLVASLTLRDVKEPLLVILFPHDITLDFKSGGHQSIGVVAEAEEQEDSVDEIRLCLQLFHGVFEQDGEAQGQEANNWKIGMQIKLFTVCC